MIGRCDHNCINQTSDGFCKTTVCINPKYDCSYYTILDISKQTTGVTNELRYSVSLEELRQAIRNVCDRIYLDESTSNFMYTKLREMIQSEIISRCKII